MINYAHRGASEYAPENTMSSFYLGLLQGSNGIETDVQRTKDGVLVLFHDDTLDRVTDASGCVCDYTLEEIKKIKVTGDCTTGFFDRIPTFEEFLQTFSQYNISFAIELKQADTEEDVIEMAKKYGITDRMTVTSFNFDYLKRTKEIDSSIRIGWLVPDPGETEIKKLKEIGGEEMAPEAKYTTEESVKMLREAGLGVRAWGIFGLYCRDLMKEMCRLGVDGMTVNFPDRLFQYLNATKF